jgi:hypothetical protein
MEDDLREQDQQDQGQSSDSAPLQADSEVVRRVLTALEMLEAESIQQIVHQLFSKPLSAYTVVDLVSRQDQNKLKTGPQQWQLKRITSSSVSTKDEANIKALSERISHPTRVKIDDLAAITDRDYKKLKMFVALKIALMDGISEMDQNDLISTILEHGVGVSKNMSYSVRSVIFYHYAVLYIRAMFRPLTSYNVIKLGLFSLLASSIPGEISNQPLSTALTPGLSLFDWVSFFFNYDPAIPSARVPSIVMLDQGLDAIFRSFMTTDSVSIISHFDSTLSGLEWCQGLLHSLQTKRFVLLPCESSSPYCLSPSLSLPLSLSLSLTPSIIVTWGSSIRHDTFVFLSKYFSAHLLFGMSPWFSDT